MPLYIEGNIVASLVKNMQFCLFVKLLKVAKNCQYQQIAGISVIKTIKYKRNMYNKLLLHQICHSLGWGGWDLMGKFLTMKLDTKSTLMIYIVSNTWHKIHKEFSFSNSPPLEKTYTVQRKLCKRQTSASRGYNKLSTVINDVMKDQHGACITRGQRYLK